MADSSARNLNIEPQQEPTRSYRHEQKMGLRPRTVPLDRLEKAILCIGAFTTIVMAALLVSTSVAATSAQHDLANYESKLTSSQNTATNLRQEIGELTSTSRMNRIAKEKGLTLIEGNIRTVD